ncbi:MAG: hypothetical protein ABS904_00575 [Solibacillus isronensis]
MKVSLAEGLDYYYRSMEVFKNGFGLRAKPMVNDVYNEVHNFLKVVSVAKSLSVGNTDMEEVCDILAMHSISLYERFIGLDTELNYNGHIFRIAFESSFNLFLNHASNEDFRLFVEPFYRLHALQDIHEQEDWKFPRNMNYIIAFDKTLKPRLINSYEKNYLEGEEFYEVFTAYRLQGKLTADFRKKD